MPINGVIERFKTGVYVVTRLPAGSLVNGELIDDVVMADVIADAVDATLDTIHSVAHGFVTGDGPVRLIGGGTLGGGIVAIDLPAPLTDVDEYFVIRVDDDTVQLATDEANALASIAIDITSTGTGGLTITSTKFQAAMSVQPLVGKDLDAAIESDKVTDVKLALCAVELRTRTPGFEADVVEVYGESYTVIKSERWDHWGTTHWRCHISRDEIA